MTQRFLLLSLVLTACGSSPKEATYDIPKTETFLWSAGQETPSWFIKEGIYKSDCIPMPKLISSTPTIYQQIEYRINRNRLGAKIETYESNSGCSALEYSRVQEAPIDMAYVGTDTKTNQKFIVYHASKQGRTLQQDFYLSHTEADLLNNYKICGKTWKGGAMNSVLDVNQASCKADVEKMAEGSLDRSMCGWIVTRAFLWDFSPALDMTLRDGESGIWVKSGPGLILDTQERFFKRVP